MSQYLFELQYQFLTDNKIFNDIKKMFFKLNYKKKSSVS